MDSTEQRAIIVRLEGVDGNAFKLLIRVRAALRDARVGKHVVDVFNAQARASEIISASHIVCTPAVYERVYKAGMEFVTYRQ